MMPLFAALILAGTAGWFIIAVEFAPTLNDVVSIYNIASLEGADRFVNGFYGPGYTFLYLLLGEPLSRLAGVYILLMTVSCLMTARLITRFSENGYIYSSWISLFFHLFLFAVLKTNYSDGIFLFMLSIGLSLYLTGFWGKSGDRTQNHSFYYEWTGLFVAGSTVLFRHHGLIFLLIFISILILTMTRTSGNFPLRRLVISWGALLLPFAMLILLSFFIPELRPESWQKFNMYRFVYGMDWYRVDLLLNSSAYQNFSLTGALINDPVPVVRSIAGVLYHAMVLVTLLILIPAVAYKITKDRFHLAVLLTVLLYLAIILPGLERGLYPLMLIVFLSIVASFYKVPRHPARNLTIFFLTLFVGGLSVFYLVKEAGKLREQNDYVQNQVEETLLDLGAVDGREIFTDDFNIWFSSFDNLKIRNFQGWLNLHPHFHAFQPNAIFQEQRFDVNNISYIVYLNNGYISEQYPGLPCMEIVMLEKHHICKL